MWGNNGDQGQGQGGYGDQGGGYMNSPAQQYGSPGMSQEKKTRSRAQSSVACTIAQIQNSKQEDERFMLDGIELHQVTIVGLVRSVKDTSTRLDYEIDDMTGPPLEVKQFIDSDENTPDEEKVTPMRENTYIRIHGHVRAFQSKRSLAAFRILPITDMNELTTHMLECVHNHLYLTKGLNNPKAGATQGTGFVPQQNQGSVQQGGQQMPDQGLTTIQNQVYGQIRSCNDEQGVSVSIVCDGLRGIPQKAVRDAIDFLSSEGHIYSTIDDEHFKSTDS